MNTDMKSKDRLDQIIDGSLALRAEIPDREGLEYRILTLVAVSESPAATTAWMPSWRWSFAGVAAVALISLAWWTTKPKQQVVSRENVSILQTLPGNGASVPQTPAKQSVAKLHGKKQPPAAAAVALVKQDVFPSPTALSEDERILLSFVRNARAGVLWAAARPDTFYADDAKPSQPLMNQVGPSSTNPNADRNTH